MLTKLYMYICVYIILYTMHVLYNILHILILFSVSYLCLSMYTLYFIRRGFVRPFTSQFWTAKNFKSHTTHYIFLFSLFSTNSQDLSLELLLYQSDKQGESVVSTACKQPLMFLVLLTMEFSGALISYTPNQSFCSKKIVGLNYIEKIVLLNWAGL